MLNLQPDYDVFPEDGCTSIYVLSYDKNDKKLEIDFCHAFGNYQLVQQNIGSQDIRSKIFDQIVFLERQLEGTFDVNKYDFLDATEFTISTLQEELEDPLVSKFREERCRDLKNFSPEKYKERFQKSVEEYQENALDTYAEVRSTEFVRGFRSCLQKSGYGANIEPVSWIYGDQTKIAHEEWLRNDNR